MRISAELRRETTVHLTTSSSGSIVRATAPLLDRLMMVDTPFAVPMRPEVARLRPASCLLECPLVGVDRKRPAHDQGVAFDPGCVKTSCLL